MQTGYYAWGQVRSYIRHVEQFISSSVDAIPLTPEQRDRLLAHPVSELELNFEYEKFLEITDIFPQLLRRSAFNLVMSLLESDLNELCEELHAAHHAQFRVYDLQGHGLERAAVYIRGVVGVQVSQFEAWGELRNLRRIRDVLVHSNGRIRASQLNESTAQIARAHQYVELVPANADAPEEDHVILVRAGLAEYSTDCAERFWNRLALDLPTPATRST